MTYDDNDRSPAPIIVMGILLLALTVALVVVRGNSGPSTNEAALNEGGAIIVEDADVEDGAVDTDDAPVADTDASDELTDEPEDTQPAITNPSGPFEDPALRLDDGVVTLTGGQPDQLTADRIAGEVAAIVGAENVVNNFVLDTRAPAAGSVGVLNTTDSITFVDNSFRVSDASQRQLELTAYVLNQHPDAILTITSHAASRGDALVATQASQADADRLVVFFSERDIEPQRIIAIGLGSAVPLDADSPELPLNKRSYLEVALP